MIINHLKTIYSGCTNDGTTASPNRSHIVRFCHHTTNAHCTIMSLLSPAFLTAQMLADEGVSSSPFHICVIITIDVDFKRKQENIETAYESVLWFIENMMPPKNGVVISIYHTQKARPWIGTPWTQKEVWPLKQQWDPQGEYITIHKVEPMMSKDRKPKVEEQQDKYLPILVDKATKCGYNIKYIDYKMRTSEIVEAISKSDYHFSYEGGTFYTAAMTGTPAYCWHSQDEVINVDGPWRNLNDEVERAIIQQTAVGQIGSNHSKIRQYDFINECVVAHPLFNLLYLENETDIDKALINDKHNR